MNTQMDLKSFIDRKKKENPRLTIFRLDKLNFKSDSLRGGGGGDNLDFFFFC